MSYLKNKKAGIFLVFIGILFVYNAVLTICKINEYGLFFIDFHARWQESAYLCHHINPYSVDNSNVIASIGFINSNMVTVPWAWILGSVMNPGFVPYSLAKTIGILVYIIIYFATSFVIYDYWKSNLITAGKKEQVWAMLASFLLGSQIYWWWSIVCGNQGAIAACLVIICICIYQKHPVLCGIFMCFAMIKPQLAAIFFLMFLLQKQYKIIAASLIGGGWHLAV